MKKLILTATAALLTFAASCGDNAPKKERQNTQEAVEKMSDEQYAELLNEIYYKLPEAVMNNFLKTEEQRRQAEKKMYHDGNYWHCDNYNEEGLRTEWGMAAYITTDNNNVVLIVQYGDGFDGIVLQFDKTLNYNIETGKITEIERPVEPFTDEEFIDDNYFGNPKLAAKAKSFFNETTNPMQLTYFNFDKNGFSVTANLFDYDEAYWDDAPKLLNVTCIWNGNRFVKGNRWYLYNGEAISYIEPVELLSQTIQIEYVTNETLNKFDSFCEYNDNDYGEKIVIWTNIIRKNFDFISVGFEDTGEQPSFFAEKILYSINELPSGKAFVVKMFVSEGIPSRGISFLDENNIKRYFYISENSLDGSLSMVEFYNNK